MKLKVIYFLFLILFSWSFLSCTATHNEQVKLDSGHYKLRFEIKNPRKKSLPALAIKVYYINPAGVRCDLGEFTSDTSGIITVMIPEDVYEHDFWLEIYPGDYKAGEDLVFPYRFNVKKKEFFNNTVYVPYTESFLKTKDTHSKLVFTRRVILNIHQEWTEEQVAKVKSGKIEEGMES
ncbi:MAG TPA: hypothetical protein ENN73_00095, partial [Firmicutes bacterium]|nr:hypothetical protein [Bacillota bacterium]